MEENGIKDSRSKAEYGFKIVNALLTLALVIVGIWYAVETRGLRIQSEDQLNELRKQFKLGITPSVYPSIVPKDKVKEAVMEGKIVHIQGESQYTKEELANAIKYHVALENIGEKLANDVLIYIYDCDTKSYLRGSTAFSFLKPKENNYMSFFNKKENYRDEKQLVKEVNEFYRMDIKSISEFIKIANNDILLLFFKDIQGDTFLRTRPFWYDKHNNRFHGKIETHGLNFQN